MTDRLVAQLVADVDRVRAGHAAPDSLVEALCEDAPLHAGQPMPATARVRGWLLATFAEVGLPEGAMPYVREELESGVEPEPVAGAARALRGGDRNADMTDLLLRAFANLRTRDAAVSFDGPSPTWPPIASTSALAEILATAEWLHQRAPDRWRALSTQPGLSVAPEVRDRLERLATEPAGACCGATAAAPADQPVPGGSVAALTETVVEGSDGRRRSLGELVEGGPCVLTFFYTRCTNPNKCAATIALLAELQDWLAIHGPRVRILALTYDPGYDSAERLLRFARDLGLDPGPRTVVGRLPGGNVALERALALRVGRGGASINRHAVQVFVLAPGGRVEAIVERRTWSAAEIGAVAATLA